MIKRSPLIFKNPERTELVYRAFLVNELELIILSLVNLLIFFTRRVKRVNSDLEHFIDHARHKFLSVLIWCSYVRV